RTREVADENRQPHVRGLEAAGHLEHRAQPNRHDDLGYDGDEEGTARVAGALQSTRVAQGHGEEQPRYAEIAKQLLAERGSKRIADAEDAEQKFRHQDEQTADDKSDDEADSRG